MKSFDVEANHKETGAESWDNEDHINSRTSFTSVATWPRRLRFVLAFLGTLICLSVIVSARGRPSHDDAEIATVSLIPDLGLPVPSRLSVTIIESNGWHDEVFTSLAPLFISVYPKARINYFLKRQRFEILPVLKAATRDLETELGIYRYDEWRPEQEDADIVVLTTCENDLDPTHVGGQLHMLKNSTQLVCVLHNSALDITTRDEVYRPLIEQGRLTFFALSEHAMKYSKARLLALSDLYKKARFRFWIPIFELGHEPDPQACVLALQGNIESSRRNFTGVMESLAAKYTANKQAVDEICDLRLNVIGSGPERHTVPESLAAKVSYHINLSYPKFYELLGQSQAIFSAFASDIYLNQKASSSVPAALIAGVPLATSREVMDKYNFVEESATYDSPNYGSDASFIVDDILSRGRAGLHAEIVRKRRAVKANKQKVAMSNRKMAMHLVHEVCPSCYN